MNRSATIVRNLVSNLSFHPSSPVPGAVDSRTQGP
jgi:hypothetical protein